MIFLNFVITCSGIVKGDHNCVQDHSKRLNLCSIWGADPLECLRRSTTCPPKQ